MGNKKHVHDLIEKFITYENWVLSEFAEPRPENIPLEYLKLFNQKPNAYSIYRQSLLKFIKVLSGEYDVFQTLNDLIERLQTRNRDLYEQVIDYFINGRFSYNTNREWKNAFQISRNLEYNEITHDSCFYYQAKYEIDVFLHFLAVIGFLYKDNIINLDLPSFRDKKGAFKKGLLIDVIEQKLDDFPILVKIIKKAYIPKLRNTIGHNKYIIEDGNLTSIDSSINISRDEFFDACYNIQELHNAILWIFSNAECNRYLNSYRDCGVLSIAFDIEDAIPKMYLFQLWCFYEIDPHKKWLQKIIFRKENNKLITEISENLFYRGSIQHLKSLLKKVREKNIIKVEIISIIPFLGDENKKITFDCGVFQLQENSFQLDLQVEFQ